MRPPAWTSTLKNLANRRPIATHYLLATAIALAVMVFSIVLFIVKPASASAQLDMYHAVYDRGSDYFNIVSMGREALRTPALFAIFVFAAAPTIAALVVTSLGGGGGRSLWLSRLRPMGREASVQRTAFLYLAILGAYAAGFGVYGLIAGDGVDAFARLRSVGGSAVIGALLGLFIDEGGSLEEMGWRGFEWPLLQSHWGRPAAAALVLGGLHWFWHMPRELPGFFTGIDLMNWISGQFVFLVLCLALSVVACYCVNVAGGSVWPAVFVHGGSNVWSKACGDFAGGAFGFGLRDLMILMIAVAILASTAGVSAAPAAAGGTNAAPVARQKPSADAAAATGSPRRAGTPARRPGQPGWTPGPASCAISLRQQN